MGKCSHNKRENVVYKLRLRKHPTKLMQREKRAKTKADMKSNGYCKVGQCDSMLFVHCFTINSSPIKNN